MGSCSSRSHAVNKTSNMIPITAKPTSVRREISISNDLMNNKELEKMSKLREFPSKSTKKIPS